MHGTIVESSDCNLTSASVTALSWFVVVDWLMSNGMVEAKDICSQIDSVHMVSHKAWCSELRMRLDCLLWQLHL
eukprot:jgi/Chrzof1/10618/Cz05g05120.t1